MGFSLQAAGARMRAGTMGARDMSVTGVRSAAWTERHADAAMVRYGDGDEAAFSIVYEVTAPTLQRFLRRRVRDAEYIEDLVQRTFLQMHRHRARFIPGASVRKWACTIAVRMLITEIEHRRMLQRYLVTGVEADAAARDADPEAECVGHELAALLEKAIARLPARHARVIGMVRGEGRSTDEAAERLHTTPNGVRIRLSRALSALRKILRGDWDDPE